MDRLRHFWHKAAAATLTLAVWAAIHAAALAADSRDAPADEVPSYLRSYALVIFCVFLGLLVALRPSHRRERAKPEVYGKPK